MNQARTKERRYRLERKPNEWWQMKVIRPIEAKPRRLMGNLTKSYDLQERYETAQAKRKLELAPHGFFRQLAPGKVGHAREFLQKFGPLSLAPGQRILGHGTTITVDLDEFWGLHFRFCLVTELSESLADRDCLVRAILRVHQNREKASKYGGCPLGTEPGVPPATTSREYTFPWQLLGQSAENWLQSAGIEELRKCALYLLNIELNTHTGGLRLIWQRGWEPSEQKFRPVIWVDSLWSSIWQFWGMDGSGVSWRRCPHCQKLFYPKRKDQFYCTRRQQSLASKRDYARRRRSGEREKNRTKSLGRSRRTLGLDLLTVKRAPSGKVNQREE
jgi:hypothetical protein